jgi:hypothetical protein
MPDVDVTAYAITRAVESLAGAARERIERAMASL